MGVGRLLRRLRPTVLPGGDRACPVCGAQDIALQTFHQRPHAECPACGSLERHRSLALWLDRSGALSEVTDVLHFAPEPGFEAHLRSRVAGRYITADLEAGRAEEQIDVCAISYDAASFDLVVCNHVLEHVPDDHLALTELHRVTRPGGLTIVSVPWIPRPTEQDPSVTDPAERAARFGQFDHVRAYGPDIVDRIAAAGFEADMIDPRTHIEAGERERFGLVHHIPGLDAEADHQWLVPMGRRPAR